MVAMVLLGFLMKGEKTGYEIKKYGEATVQGVARTAPKIERIRDEALLKESQEGNS